MGLGQEWFSLKMISSRSLFSVWSRKLFMEKENHLCYIFGLTWKSIQVASPESIFGGPVCYCQFGLPTILARMIDEGINPRDVDRLYFWGWVMFAIILLGIVGRIILSYAVGQLTTTMVRDMRNDSMLSYRSTRITSMSKLGYRHWSLAWLQTPLFWCSLRILCWRWGSSHPWWWFPVFFWFWQPVLL